MKLNRKMENLRMQREAHTLDNCIYGHSLIIRSYVRITVSTQYKNLQKKWK